MKTILEWYEELPSPIREQAIENYYKEELGNRKKKVYDIYEAIFYWFHWNDSPEWGDYWYNIFEKLKKWQPLIEEDGKEDHIVNSNKMVEFEEWEIVEVRDDDDDDDDETWLKAKYLYTSKYNAYCVTLRGINIKEKIYDKDFFKTFYCKQIRKLQKTTVTKQEIADWKGCDVNNVDILWTDEIIINWVKYKKVVDII